MSESTNGVDCHEVKVGELVTHLEETAKGSAIFLLFIISDRNTELIIIHE